MITVPTDKQELIAFTQELVQQCNVSISTRSSQYRLLNQIYETGRADQTKALLNELPKQLEDTAAHLYSPVELKLTLDFENSYPKAMLDKGAVVARAIRRQWERNNTDITFGQGVVEALKYGLTLMKQRVQVEGEGDDEVNTYHADLLMPWQFGVYNERVTDINKQIALCETFTITLPEVWRRIYHMPGAEKLFNRIRGHAQTNNGSQDMQQSSHWVLSTSQLNTGVNAATNPLPGGIVQLANDPNYVVMGAQVSAPTVTGYELWVQDDTDYTTIIMIEPDIIIAPLYKKANLLVKDSKLQPYRMIQPNMVVNWFWGRSDLINLVEPQGLLATWLDDAKRLTGLQIDKILGFAGDNTIMDEKYGQMREAGFVSVGQGTSITDLTPAFPSELLPMIKFLLEELRMLGGFPPIMRGQGEPGVRAGSHADSLMKTASPTLRDRALLVERQCSEHADLSLAIREAKDPDFMWTHGETPQAAEQSRFQLADLPPDWRMMVDSHSSSPIFSEDNKNEIYGAFKMQIVGPQYVIKNTGLPDKETALAELHERQQKAAEEKDKLFKTFPDAAEKVAVKQLTGKR